MARMLHTRVFRTKSEKPDASSLAIGAAAFADGPAVVGSACLVTKAETSGAAPLLCDALGLGAFDSAAATGWAEISGACRALS